MEVLLAIVISVLFACALRKQIKRYAVSFYIVAVAVDVLFLSGVLFGVSRGVAAAVYPYLTRCLLGFALFALVMYIGALPEGSRARQMLMPIRGELSIIAAILTIGHVANYLGTYLADILSGFAGMSAGMIASFVVSSLLIVLLAALTVTSFNAVKTRMSSDPWTRLPPPRKAGVRSAGRRGATSPPAAGWACRRPRRDCRRTRNGASRARSCRRAAARR